jgi:hypothetical protein
MSGKEPWNLLHEPEGGLKLMGNANVFIEEVGTGAAESRAFSGNGEILAGGAPGQKVNWADAAEGSHVIPSLDGGPASGEYPLAEGVELDLAADASSGAFQSNVKASDPAEERDDIHSQRL